MADFQITQVTERLQSIKWRGMSFSLSGSYTFCLVKETDWQDSKAVAIWEDGYRPSEEDILRVLEGLYPQARLDFMKTIEILEA